MFDLAPKYNFKENLEEIENIKNEMEFLESIKNEINKKTYRNHIGILKYKLEVLEVSNKTLLSRRRIGIYTEEERELKSIVGMTPIK